MKNKARFIDFASKIESLFPLSLVVLIMTAVSLSTYVISKKALIGDKFILVNEDKVFNASKSLSSLETNRIERIDSQLTILYANVYTSNDSLIIKKSLQEIQFLKEQRFDALKSIAETKKQEDSPTTLFTVVLAILSISLATLFTSTLKNSSSTASTTEKKKTHSEHQSISIQLPIIEKFEEFKERIIDESTRLNKQAVINLFLCFFIAFAFMGFVGYTTIYKSGINDNSTWTSFIMSYIPKLTGILGLLTMFLYFVRLYKTNIIDAKYYQNELTNIEFKYLALISCFEIKNDDAINTIIKEFVVTDRNSVLLKDQTTLELERIKIENELNKNYLSQIWELKTIFIDKKDSNS